MAELPDQLWAKGDGEEVSRHTANVLRNLGQLRDRTPDLGGLTSLRNYWSVAAVAVAIHDLGKCCKGFQAMLRSGPRFAHRHEVLSLAFLPWVLGKNRKDVGWVGAAVVTHHKNWSEIQKLYPPADVLLDTPDGLEGLSQQLTVEFYLRAERVVREEIWPEVKRGWAFSDDWQEPDLSDWTPEHGIGDLRTTISEIGKLMRRLKGQHMPDPELITGTLLRGAMILADHSGSAHEQFRKLTVLKNVEATREKLGLPGMEELYEHQREAANIVGNMVLTAPTGSGKTEAAMLWAARQSGQSAGLPVVYYLLPFQASLNAMRQRLADKFGDGSVTLQHSRAVQAVYRQLLDHKGYTGEIAERVAKQEKNLAKLHVKPLRISTPYQLLKGSFQLKGHEALWTAAARGLFILDEVHVYETSRLAILLATLRYLCRELGGTALIMSATLPRYLSSFLERILPSVRTVAASSATLAMFRRHEIHLVDGELTDAAVMESILGEAKKGLAVLVVATTVGRAQILHDKLRREFEGDVEILHGRFHADDRATKELSILAKRGVGKSRGEAGLILVATQVVEVSLNIDFDVLYSDPAPIEALLQRFGRVNRGRGAPLRTVNICRTPPEGAPVYPSVLVKKAVAALEPHNGKPFEEESVQHVLGSVYDSALSDSLAQALELGMKTFTEGVLSSCRPFDCDERIEELFEQLFDGYEVIPGSLEKEYWRRMEEQPLLAPGLLVPITRGQYFSLQKKGKLRRQEYTLIADCPYTDRGLELSGPPREDGI